MTEMTFNVNRVIKNQDLLGCEKPPMKKRARERVEGEGLWP